MNAFELIGAFVDGERVDPDALKTALATDEGRQYLVDLAALRELTRDSVATAMLDTPAPKTSSPARTHRTAWPPIAAAAALVCAMAGGFAAGRYTNSSAASARQRFVDATNNEGRLLPAPQPTSIIKLQPGVDWHEQITRN